MTDELTRILLRPGGAVPDFMITSWRFTKVAERTGCLSYQRVNFASSCLPHLTYTYEGRRVFGDVWPAGRNHPSLGGETYSHAIKVGEMRIKTNHRGQSLFQADMPHHIF